MRWKVRTLTWHGEPYCFARIPGLPAEGGSGEWAVARGGEFIGTMPCAQNITTGEFEVRCMRWLSDLLG